MSAAKIVTLAPSKQVEPNLNKQKGAIKFPFAIPIEPKVAMFYLNIKKPLDWEPPVAEGDDETWMIERGAYQAEMKKRRQGTINYLATKKEKEQEQKEEEDREIKHLTGELALPWVVEVDLSDFVRQLLARGFRLVGTERGFSKDGKNQMVWISFVDDRLYRPPVEEFANLKQTVLEWLQDDMLASDKRMSVTIFVNPLLVTGKRVVDPNLACVAITTDRDHEIWKARGGLNLQFTERGLVIDHGPINPDRV